MMFRLDATTANEITVGDAYVRTEVGGTRWRIGSQGIEQVLECSNGQLLLTSYKNKLTQPVTEYIAPATACAPFGLDIGQYAGRFSFDEIWSKSLDIKSSLDPANDKVTLDVKKGQLLGFCALGTGDDVSEAVDWATKVTYVNGPSFVSSEETQLGGQGPVWFYYQRASGSGCLEELGETCSLDIGGVAVTTRVATGYRAPFETHGIGATHFVIKNSFTLMRAWKAPQDGKVTIHGQAKLIAGKRARLSIVRINEIDAAAHPLPKKNCNSWKLKNVETSQVNAGGRPAAQLTMIITRGTLQAKLRIVAYPHTPVLRQWVTLENQGETAITLPSPGPLLLCMDDKNAASYINYWMCGGTSRPNQGVLRQSPMDEAYHHALLGERSDNLVPWTACQRKDGPADGCFVALDYLGTWNISLDRAMKGPSTVSITLPTLANYSLAPGESLNLPVTTTGVFQRDLDDMGRHLYDWQYEYMWDRTNADYYALSKWAVAWFPCSRNLQEQFTARLALLDMDADLMREMGFDMLWDDAGLVTVSWVARARQL